MKELIVKDKALINAIYNLVLVEQHLILLMTRRGEFVLKTVQIQKIFQKQDQAKCNNQTENAATDIFL